MFFISILIAIIFSGLALFQLLLASGKPYGEYAMGGFHKVLPTSFRLISVSNAFLLLAMALAFLINAGFFADVFSFLPLTPILWGITIFLGLNTIANGASRSKKERNVMTPISGGIFILCLLVLLM